MRYLTIDGDDVGQRIATAYLRNNLSYLREINDLVGEKTNQISDLLVNHGYVVIFCAADGVAAYHNDDGIDELAIFDAVKRIAGGEMTFSAGAGSSLRDSYIALLSAKSGGKARLHKYEDI